MNDDSRPENGAYMPSDSLPAASNPRVQCVQANAASKKTAASNARTLAFLRNGFFLSHLIYLAHLYIYWNSTSRSQLLLYTLSSVVSLGLGAVLTSMASNKMQNGVLQKAGDDLSQPGRLFASKWSQQLSWFGRIDVVHVRHHIRDVCVLSRCRARNVLMTE